MSDENLKKVVADVAAKEHGDETKKEEFVQLVVFELDKEEYTAPITDLHEIIKIPEITPIPNAPDFIRGILNLRGKIVMVVDLEKRFHLVRENQEVSQHIIVVEVGENTFGVIVDEVVEVLRVPTSVIKPTPSIVCSKIHTDYLKGVVVLQEGSKSEEKRNDEKSGKTESRLLILLDLPKMLSDEELLQVGDNIQEITRSTD